MNSWERLAKDKIAKCEILTQFLTVSVVFNLVLAVLIVEILYG